MCNRFLIVLCSLIFLFTSVQAQQSADSLLQNPSVDSLTNQPARRVQFSGIDTVSGRVSQTLEQLTSDLNMVNGVLKRGLDTLEIHDELPAVARLLENIKSSIFGPEISPSLRGLNAAKVLLIQNEAKLDSWQ